MIAAVSFSIDSVTWQRAPRVPNGAGCDSIFFENLSNVAIKRRWVGSTKERMIAPGDAYTLAVPRSNPGQWPAPQASEYRFPEGQQPEIEFQSASGAADIEMVMIR